MATKDNNVSGWVGWIFFAGFMMILLGAFQAIAGLTALLKDTWLVVGEQNLLVLDFTTWGWIHLILGVVVLIAGFSVMQGRTWARILGVIFAGLVVVSNLAYISAYPLWSVLTITVAVLVIFALTVHGGELKESQ
jgi:hypothetical protein